MHPSSWKQVEQIIDRALAEDLSFGDVTTEALISPEQQGRAAIIAGEEGVLAGVEVAKEVFLRVDPSLRFEALFQDAAKVRKGDVVAVIKGKAGSILKGERVALNFLTRLSGIASETARYVEATKGLKVWITDTRKTTPGIRPLEKYAVRVGGGKNHRQHLGDGILIKDNHLAAFRSLGLGIKEAIQRARQSSTLKVEVEVESVGEGEEALEAGADALLLDNMAIEDMRQVVELAKGRALIEASGGITLDNVRQVAESGVDLISVGALTHSVKALDLSLELEA
ncbi:MAG: carboxylating nicotinate-nucleotide diphosphorylase [Chloroflexi bacterium]|nr:carboxylating nicotinate-nucleotide diphosphorylase [Chloroflexota bacterium]